MLLEHQKFCSHIPRISTLRVNYLALVLTIFKPTLPRQECENVNDVIKEPVLRGGGEMWVTGAPRHSQC
jgi:hypothetical protein